MAPRRDRRRLQPGRGARTAARARGHTRRHRSGRRRVDDLARARRPGGECVLPGSREPGSSTNWLTKHNGLRTVVFNQLVEHGRGGAMPADELSKVFSALADPTRRDIVSRLAAGDASVGELAAPYDVSIQAVSKHLKVLEDCGLVSRSRDAQRRPCHLEAEVFDLMTKWIERYRREAEERFQRLDAVLVRMTDEEPEATGPQDETGAAAS